MDQKTVIMEKETTAETDLKGGKTHLPISEFNQRRNPATRPTPKPTPYVYKPTGNFYDDLIGEQQQYQSSVGGNANNLAFNRNPEFKAVFTKMMTKAGYASPIDISTNQFAVQTLYSSFTAAILSAKDKSIEDKEFIKKVSTFITESDSDSRYKRGDTNLVTKSFYFVQKLNEFRGVK